MNVIIDEIAKRAFEICDKFGIAHPSHREMFAGGYREGLKVNPWHKTSEELPNEQFDDGYQMVIVNIQIDEDSSMISTDYIKDGKWALHTPDKYPITHWMEIPELPKED